MAGGLAPIRRGPPLALALACLLSCASGPGTHAKGMLPARWTAADGTSQEVPFSYESQSDTHGVMYATLGKGGEHFRGSYVRVEKSTKGHLVTAVYDGWSSPEWQVWEHDPDGEWTATATSYGDFAHFYSGKVVATLTGSEHHLMRCHFTLKAPEAGLLGGGEGECQISDRGRVHLQF